MKRILLKTQFVALLFLMISNTTFAQWQKVNDIDSFPRARETTFVIGDTAYLGNGDQASPTYTSDFRGYTQNSNTWVEEPTYPGGGGDFGFCFVINDTAYLGDGANPGYLNTFYAYNPSTGWVNKGTVPGGVRAACLGFSIGNKGYFGTGFNGSTAYSDFYEYNPATATWTQKKSLPVALGGGAAFSINGKGYIGLGGNGDYQGTTLTGMYRYDPTTDIWDTMAPLPTSWGMEEPSYFVLCGKLIVTLGDTIHTGYSTTRQTWMFDPSNGAKGTWTRLEDFPGPLPAYSAQGWAMGDTGFVYGGYNQFASPNYRSDMYRYVPTVVTVTPVDTTVCAGEPVKLSASGSASYLWSTNDTTSSITVSPASTTTYIVTASGAVCNAGNDSVIVNVASLLSVSVLPDSPSVCRGQSVLLTATTGTAANYQWVNTMDTTNTITVSPSNDTTYELVVSNGRCSKDTLISVKVNTAPPLTVSPQPPPSFCSGSNAELKVSGGGTNFIWTPSTGLSATTGDSVLASPTVTTTYAVTGKDTLGCPSSGTEKVTVFPAPIIPTVTQSGNILKSSAQYQNQWYLNDTLLVGDTSQYLTITTGGEYRVSVTNEANGCSSASDSANITTGINQLSVISAQLSIYPNPFTNNLFIKINTSAQDVKDWTLQITDVLGQTVHNQLSLNYSNAIDLSNLSSGVYFITVISKTGRAVFPVVK